MSHNFKPGDKVRFADDFHPYYQKGDVATVDTVDRDGWPSLKECKWIWTWNPGWFEHVDPQPGNRAPEIIVVDPSPVHLRPYDFEAGDERRFDREEAIAVAQRRVRDRGCRQQVRSVSVDEHDATLVPRWIIQDI